MSKFSAPRARCVLPACPGSPARLLRAAALLTLGLCLAGPLSAYTPIYSVKKQVTAQDVHPGVSKASMTLTGFDGRYLSGYVGYVVKLGQVSTSHTEAFLWDEQSQTLTNLSTALGVLNSLTTCAGDGAVGGVYWTDGFDPQQLGFFWQNGTLHTFAAPDGNSIDSVTAVGYSGAAGTYLSGYGLKRAFFWYGDAYAPSDLGDLGDPDHSFVWPQAVGDYLQVVGTVYHTADGSAGSARTTAFQWSGLAPIPGMTALDGTAAFSQTGALAMDLSGAILGGYLKLSAPGTLDAGTFFSADHQVTDLATLAGGGLEGSALSYPGLVTGTGYDASGRLRLYRWQVGQPRVDLGTAALHADDQDSRLTNVSLFGEQMAGIVTAADGSAHAFVRNQGQPWDLALVGAAASPFTPGVGAASATVLVDDNGTVACPGAANGAAAVAILTEDLDGNGLPDGWEVENFGHAGVDGDGDADGDGVSNSQEYRAGTDPQDFYDGHVPVPSVVGGGDQRGAPGTVLAQPVCVTVAGRRNAPLHLAVTAGGALIGTAADGAFNTTLDLVASGRMPTVGGGQDYGVSVYVRLPAGRPSVSTLQASTSSGAHAAQGVHTTAVSTTAAGVNVNLAPPGGLRLGLNTATTLDIAWSPADPALGTAAEVSHDGGATWKLQASFAAGTSQARLYHLRPDHTVWVRLYALGTSTPTGANGTPPEVSADAGGGGGNGADPNGVGGGPGAASEGRDLLSVPRVLVEQVRCSAFNSSFRRAGSTTGVRYLQQDIDTAYTNDAVFFAGQTFFVRELFSPPQGSFDDVISECSDPLYFSQSFQYIHDWVWQAQSDTVMKSPLSDSGHYGTATLSRPYTLADFRAAVEGAVPAFRDERSEGCGQAWTFFEKTNDRIGNPLTPFPNSSDHSYDLAKLQYKFRCNADPEGVVAYDVVFTPEDGGAPVHEVHVVPTHGQTEVGAPGPENRPFGLDPTQAANPALLDASQPTGKRNGSYRVVPVALQPDDWPDDPDAENRPSLQARGAQPDDVDPDAAGQSGFKGNLVPSILTPSTTKHFVSPRSFVGDAVRLRAQLPKDLAARFDEYFEWVKPQDPDTGAEVGVADGAFFDVPRDKPGKYTVTVRTKVQPPLSPAAALPVDTINVWIVWAEGRVKQPQPRLEGYVVPGADNIGNGTRERSTIFQTLDPEATSPADLRHWAFIFDIQPKSITDLAQDVPDLTGKADPDYPPCDKNKTHLATGLPLWEGAPLRWDVTQAMRVEIDNPNKVEQALLPVFGRVFDGQPLVHTIREDFPSSDVEGNDDFLRETENNDPYHPTAPNELSALAHGVGSVTTIDFPSFSIAWFRTASDQQRFNGATFHQEADFATFVRLQIGKKWYRVSGHYNWFFSMRMKCTIGDANGFTEGIWVNDFSKTNYTGVSQN